MADQFDPYREALVMEAVTIWPEEYDDWEVADRQKIEVALHSHPETATHLEYVRMHSGFRRQITVTADDLERIQ